MTRLAVLHTLTLMAERFKVMIGERYPDLDCFHMVDESLLQDLIRHGETPGIVRRVATHAALAQQAGADLLLFTCSSASPAVDTARRLVDIPIVKIDDAMAEKAVALGRRIGIVCTTPSTRGPSADLIRAHAARANRPVEVVSELREPAYRALLAGDRATHDAIVSAAALDLAERCDVVVLAQASLAHLAPAIQDRTAVPILASPELCIAALARWLDG